jgi:signal transduction histidine kinase
MSATALRQTTVSATPASLFDPWRKPWGWAALGLMHALFTFFVWLLIAGFDWTRLTRSQGWEPAGVLGCSLLLHVAFSKLQARLTPDPRLGQAVFWALLVCLAGVLLGAGVAAATPDWIIEHAPGKKIHPINGALLASFLGIAFFVIWLVFADLRLTALEPMRERRLRALQEASDEADAKPAPSRQQRALARAKSWFTWRVPAAPDSSLLDAFTWPRTIVRTLVDATLLSLLLGLVLSFVVNLGAFGPKEVAMARLQAAADSYPDWFTWGGSYVLMGAGAFVLAFCRSYASWVGRSLTGAVLLVWVSHLTMIAITQYAVPRSTDFPVLDTVNWMMSLLFALRTTTLLNSRTSLIDTAQRIEQDRTALKVESQRAQAISDLRALQAQIEPHFLYNTLASVQLLIRHDSERADDMTGHLIDYLRARLPLMRQASTSLGNEFELIKSYLQIMKIRMGDRLQTRFELPADCEAVQLPPLSVMTLVENAIKHGLEPKRGGGEIVLSAQRLDSGWVRIRVADTGAGFGATSNNTITGTGVGITNVQERLRLSYAGQLDASGQAARLELSQNEPSGVIADIIIPA